MTGQSPVGKPPPISWKPPRGPRVRLLAYAAAAGLPVNRVITQAVDAWLAGQEREAAGE